MRVVLSLPLLLLGCYPPPDCADGYARNDAGKCKGGAEDVDTAVTDSAAPTSADFSGAIEIEIIAETGGLVLEDLCAGTVDITVEASAVDGTLSCVFSGTVGGIIGTDPFLGTLSGEVAEDGTVAGPLDMELGAFGALAATWGGTATDEGVDGSFGEETIFVVGALEVPVNYTGSFSAR